MGEKTHTAKHKSFSLYDDQRNWVKEEARRIAEKTGREFSESKVIQQLIDQARNKQKGGK